MRRRLLRPHLWPNSTKVRRRSIPMLGELLAWRDHQWCYIGHRFASGECQVTIARDDVLRGATFTTVTAEQLGWEVDP